MTDLFPNEEMTIEGADWHELRLQNIGGSEIAGLFDVQQAYQLSRYGLFQVKSRLAEDDFSGNERTLWGNRLEQAIAEGLAEENGWTVRKGGYFRDAYTQGMGSTLDYIITSHPEHEGPGVLEIKNVDGIVFNEKWIDDEPPLHILLQMQHQLACSGFKWGIIGALIGGNTTKTYFYEARPGIISQIRQRVDAFWNDVREYRVPPVDGSDNTSKIIKAMNSPVRQEEVNSDDEELFQLCQEFDETRKVKKEAEEAHKVIKNRIAAKVADIKRTNVGQFIVSQIITAEKPDRVALPGEIISGRAEIRRYDVKIAKKKKN